MTGPRRQPPGAGPWTRCEVGNERKGLRSAVGHPLPGTPPRARRPGAAATGPGPAPAGAAAGSNCAAQRMQRGRRRGGNRASPSGTAGTEGLSRTVDSGRLSASGTDRSSSSPQWFDAKMVGIPHRKRRSILMTGMEHRSRPSTASLHTTRESTKKLTTLESVNLYRERAADMNGCQGRCTPRYCGRVRGVLYQQMDSNITGVQCFDMRTSCRKVDG